MLGDILWVMLGIMIACSLIPGHSMTPVAEFPGYRRKSTKLDFRDVQHNPNIMEHLENLSYTNESITTVHANNIGVKTFQLELELSVKEIEYGLDQSCDNINKLMDECKADPSQCQYTEESITINERGIRKYVQAYNIMKWVCRPIASDRKRGDDISHVWKFQSKICLRSRKFFKNNSEIHNF